MLNFHLQPIQDKLFELYEYGKATKIGYGGPRGGTKSHTSDILMLGRRILYPGTNGLFIMRVYQDMWDIHIQPMFDAYPELENSFNKQGMVLRLSNGSYIRYLSGDNLETFQKRKGRGFADIMIDQSELFSKEEIEFLYTINRSVVPGITPKTLLCFNPGNVGHAYHKRVFYDKYYEENETPEEFGYLQAKGWDNAYWSLKQMAARFNINPTQLDHKGVLDLVDEYHKLPEKERFDMFLSSDYGRVLDGQPAHKREQELFGNMDIFEGMFWEDFRRGHHVIEKDIGYDNRLDAIGGLDYGNTTVLEVLQVTPEGRILAADECYLDFCTNPIDRANEIADFLLEREIYGLEIVYDTDMEISQLSNIGVDKTPIAIFRDIFRQRMGKDKEPKMICVNKKSLDKNKPYRIVVNEAVKAYLKIDKETKFSKLYISKRCKELIKFFEQAIYPPDEAGAMDFYRPKDGKKDHQYDGFKYGFMRLYKPVKKPKDNRPNWVKNLLEEYHEKVSTQSDFYAT